MLEHEATDLDAKYKVDSVVLAMKILECVAWADDPKGVTQISREVSSTKNRVFRHLETLRSLGYVTRDHGSERYHPGNRFALVGAAVAESSAVTKAVKAPLRQARDTTGETTVFGATIQGHLTIMAMESGIHPIEIGLRLGSTYDLHATAQGKLALAYMDPSDVEDLLSIGPLTAHTPHTIVERDVLREELELIRKRGWAAAPEQIQSGVNVLAAPIFNRLNECVGTIGLVGFIDRIPDPPDKKQLEAIHSAAQQASRNLGWGGKQPSSQRSKKAN